MQLLGPVQLTARSASAVAPGAEALGEEDHVAPFHCSASVSLTAVEVFVAKPTAMHHAGPVHETPASSASLNPEGAFNPVAIDQLDPFHMIANGWVSELASPVNAAPTATQKDDEVHDTDRRTVLAAPAGPGTDWVVHVEPFQICTKTFTPGLVSCNTVATQKLEDTHETVLS